MTEALEPKHCDCPDCVHSHEVKKASKIPAAMGSLFEAFKTIRFVYSVGEQLNLW